MARRSRGAWPLAVSLRAYRLLLGFYPAPFRRCWGPEMAQLFGDLAAEAWRRRGRRGLAALWATTLADLAASLPREHLARARRPRPSNRAARRRYHLVAARVGAAPNPTLYVTRFMTRTGRTTMYLLKRLWRWMWRWLLGLQPRPAPHPMPRSHMRPPPDAFAGGDRDRFDKFTNRARKVMDLAQEEARRFHHNYIGTEHLLLGLVREGEGVGAQVLRDMDVDLDRVRRAVEFIIGRGDRVVLGEIGITPRAKKVIELAVDEARRMGHRYIGTEHLLLGLVREGEGIAAGVLQQLGVRLERVRAETLRVLGDAHKRRWDAGDQPPPDAPPPDAPPAPDAPPPVI